MRALRNALRPYETRRCKSKNRGAKCVFCPSPGTSSIILDCDRIKEMRKIPGAMSDCIIIEPHGALHAAVVELKGSSYSSDRAKSQLVAGANLAMDMLDELKLGSKARLHLVLVAPSHPFSRRKFACYRQATVRGKKLPIHTVRCGASLSQIIYGA